MVCQLLRRLHLERSNSLPQILAGSPETPGQNSPLREVATDTLTVDNRRLPTTELDFVMSQSVLQGLAQPADTRLVLLVVDGLGGLAQEPNGLTELEAARTPNMDLLAAEGQTGLSQAIGPGITSGSGPGHLALFGYDPVSNNVGRGALSALGLGVELNDGDVAVRLNFCTVDDQGRILDRRAGRIDSSLNSALVSRLNAIDVPGIDLQFLTESQHRAVLVLRGSGLDPRIAETDPQRLNVSPVDPEAVHPEAQRTSDVLKHVLAAVRECIGRDSPANFVLMRGYAGRPVFQGIDQLYRINPLCIATYPMYKGLARAVGMDVAEGLDTLSGEVAELGAQWNSYDYFFLHVKAPDARGEDGDFDGKVAAIEEVDASVPDILQLQPDVLVVTGDHSTPAVLRQHSWHPSPFLIWGQWVRPDRAEAFGERASETGGLGVFPAQSIMAMMLGHGGRLAKFGA